MGSEKCFQVLSLDVPEDPEPSDLIDSTPEVHCTGRVDGWCRFKEAVVSL